jgi:superfamily I DNA and RNA helicase
MHRRLASGARGTVSTPEPRRIVERTYNGAARVAGSAGTDKTVVALHRAHRLLSENPEAKVLLATFLGWARRHECGLMVE